MAQPLDYTREAIPPRPTNRTAVVTFFAALCGLFAGLKSAQYHDHGQLSQERWETIFLITLSGVCVVIVLARLRRYAAGRHWRLVFTLLCCGFAVACIALAIVNLRTATVGAKDTLF